MILRPGVLAGVRVVAGGAVAARMAELGADVNPAGEEAEVLVWEAAPAAGVEGVRAALDEAWDCDPSGDAWRTRLFAPSVEGVRAVLDEAWDAIRAVLSTTSSIILIAPPPGDAHAEAARAGLENMARTLSIEWARRGIRPVAITRERRRARPRSPSSPPSSRRRPAPTTPAAASILADCRVCKPEAHKPGNRPDPLLQCRV